MAMKHEWPHVLAQIMAGLRKHVSRSELEGSHVIVILNLKTARLAGADPTRTSWPAKPSSSLKKPGLPVPMNRAQHAKSCT